MFNKTKNPLACKQYEARLEDHLDGFADAELTHHLAQCDGCRRTLEESRLAADLVREVWEPSPAPREAFVTGVLTRIREEKLRVESPAAFWRPLEFLASRLSLSAAVALLAISAYLVGFAPHRVVPPPSDMTELSASDFPQPPGEPDSNEEILQSLSERHYGR